MDGCYSHWVGGCFPLIEACLGVNGDDSDFPAAPDSLFSREGLIRYVLGCCQNPERGGLRDKPGKGPDPYHTCYTLAGLSSAQHQWQLESRWDGQQKPQEDDESLVDEDPVWLVLPHFDDVRVYEKEDLVRATHPVYAIPQQCQRAMRRYFAGKRGF